MSNSLTLDPTIKVHIAAYSGKQLTDSFVIYDKDDNIIPLTSWTAQGLVFNRAGTTIMTLTPTVTAATGTVSLDQLVSGSIPLGRYDYFIDLIDSGGDVRPTFRGNFLIKDKTSD